MKPTQAFARIVALTFARVLALVLFCAGTAYGWHLPVSGEYVVTNGFWECGVACYHLGDDVRAPEGTQIRSIGDGVVKEVNYNPSTANYGGRVLIEYANEGEPFVALYGHLGQDTTDPDTDDIYVTVGQHVSAGAVIGRAGSRSENGGWAPHLHFAINRGPYIGGATECGRWRYAGYTARAYLPTDACYCDIMDNWWDPSEFLSVRAKELRIVSGGVSPDSGITEDTEFTWQCEAEGGRGNPITASVIIVNPTTYAATSFPMNYVSGTDSPFEFQHTGQTVGHGLYRYKFRLETCADRVEEQMWRYGPSVSRPPRPWYCYGPEFPERCDRIDNDCDRLIDENITRACTNECGNVGVQVCDPDGEWDTVTGGAWRECSAAACVEEPEPEPEPPPPPPGPPPCVPVAEVCDNADNNCNGLVDDGVSRSCSNECGNVGTQSCSGGAWGGCSASACPPPPPPPEPEPEPPPAPGLPPTPVVIGPGNGAIVPFMLSSVRPGGSASVALSWNPVTGATHYEYQIRFGGFGESGAIADGATTSATSHNFTVALNNFGVQFGWKVRAHGPGGASGWSAVRTFFASYTIGTIVVCEGTACPSPGAWYKISASVYDIGIIGAPALLIADWINGACSSGLRARSVNYGEMSGYHRSARYNGCPP